MQNLAENVSEILTPSRFHTARVNGETCPGVMRAFSAYRDWLGK